MQSSGPVLLLDLGGVLADLGDPVSALGLQMTQREFWRVWTTSSTVRAFETGQMDVADFLFKVSAELGYSGDEPFARRFQAWQLRSLPFNNVRALFSFGLPANGVVHARAYVILGSLASVSILSSWAIRCI